MLYLLSPAKTLDYKTPLARGVAARATEPLLMNRAAELIAQLAQLTHLEQA